MTTGRPTRPWTVASFLTRQIELSDKTQVEIAEEAGFDNPNVLTMFKQGRTKLPVDRVPAVADALGVSRSLLLELALREYQPEIADVVEEVAGMMLSSNEANIVTYLREITGGQDPGIDDEVKQKLRDAFPSSKGSVP